jgi:hypothetical protein
MRHFSSFNTTSFVLRNRLSAVMQKSVMREFVEVLEPSSFHSEEEWVNTMVDFVFEGNRGAACCLHEELTPAEFRVVVGFRIWYKNIDKQFKYRSPRFWFRTTDFVYTNLNSGKCFVCVDAHYWD